MRQGPGRPKKQTEHVYKSTGNDNKDRGGDKEREEDIVACKHNCGKTFDTNKKTGKANKANHEKGCGKRAAKRAADDDSGDAHLSGEGHKKKQRLPSKCSPLWLHVFYLCLLDCLVIPSHISGLQAEGEKKGESGEKTVQTMVLRRTVASLQGRGYSGVAPKPAF